LNQSMIELMEKKGNVSNMKGKIRQVTCFL